MKQLVFAAVLVLFVPAVRAQQADTNAGASQGAPPVSTEPAAAASDANSAPSPSAAPRQGHPLDPADVDILTGKRDREIEAARRASVPVTAGGYGEYGYYGDRFLLSGRRGAEWDIPMLPLTAITNPFFFSRMAPFGFGGRARSGGRR